MRRFRTRLIAYEAVGERLGELPHPLDWSASFPRNDVGSLTLRYSGHAARGDLVTRPLTDGLEIAVEVCTDDTPWTEVRGGRFVMLSRTWRADDGQRIMTLTGPSYGWLLSKQKILNINAVLGGSHHQAGSWPFYQASAGEVMHTLMSDGWQSENQPFTWSFTSESPTGGGAWTRSETQFYPLGTDHLKVLEKLVGLGLCDWHTQGRELVLTPADSAAVDRSDVLALHLGTDVVEAPSSEDLAPVAETVVFRGGTDDVTRITTGNAPSPWGYWQALRTDERVTVPETADRFVAEAAGEARMRASYGRDLTPTAKALPLVDFHPGDWIRAPGATGMERLRVAECSLRSDGRHITPAVVLNDRHTDRQVRLARTAREAAEKVDAIAADAIGPARSVDARSGSGESIFTVDDTGWRLSTPDGTDLMAWDPSVPDRLAWGGGESPIMTVDDQGGWAINGPDGSPMLSAGPEGWGITPWGDETSAPGISMRLVGSAPMQQDGYRRVLSDGRGIIVAASVDVELTADRLYRASSDLTRMGVRWAAEDAADALQGASVSLIARPVTPGQSDADLWAGATPSWLPTPPDATYSWRRSDTEGDWSLVSPGSPVATFRATTGGLHRVMVVAYYVPAPGRSYSITWNNPDRHYLHVWDAGEA